MKSTIVFRTMLCSLTLASTLAWAKEPATTQAISNTRYGRRVVSVSFNEYGPDFNDLIAFLNRRAADLGPSLLNIPAEKVEPPVFNINTNGTMRGFELELEFNPLDLPDVRPAAREFLNAMVTTAETYIREGFDQRKSKEELAARRDRDVCAEQLAESTQQAQKLRATLRDLAGRADVSAQGVTAAVSRLEEEREKLELDILGKKARSEALEKEIAAQADELQRKAQNDPVVVELKKVVDVREAKLDQLRKLHDSGTVADADVQDAIAAVAEARVKLVERQRGGGAGAGGPGAGETLEALSRERVNLSIDLRELQVRLEFVEKRLPGLRGAMDKLDELQRAEGDLKNSSEALAASANHLRELSRHLETADPPQVLLKSSTDMETAPGR